MPAHRDTIAAIATAAGSGGIGVVRVSGPRAAAIARGLLGRKPRPRRAVYAALRDAAGVAIDRGLVLYFPGPASSTGDDACVTFLCGDPLTCCGADDECTAPRPFTCLAPRSDADAGADASTARVCGSTAYCGGRQ